MQLRYYQTEKMVNPAIDKFRNGAKGVALVAPTGSGKTAVAAWWAQQANLKNRNVLTLTHKGTIQRQMMQTFNHFGLSPSPVSSGKKVTDNNLQIAMIGTLINRLSDIPTPDWILADEFHHFRESNMWGKAIGYYREKNPDLKLLGLTATPNGRVDGMGLHPFADDMVSDLSIEYLVNDGWLVYPHTMIGQKIDVPKFHMVNGDYDKKEQFNFFSGQEVIGNVVDNYHTYLDGKPNIISCVSLEHAYFVKRQYDAFAKSRCKNWKNVMVQGGKKYEKQLFDAIAGLISGSVQNITFVDVLGEGVDVPHCSSIQMLRKMQSLVLVLQFIGRTLRPVWPDWFDQHNSTKEERLAVIRDSIKPRAEIQDFAGNCHPEAHGHPMSKRAWTLADTRTAGKKCDQFPKPLSTVCPICSGVWPGEPDTCPDCGHDLHAEREHKEGRKLPKEIEGILKDYLPQEDSQIIASVADQALRLQHMNKGDRMRHFRYNVKKYGDCARTRGLAKALGYNSGLVYRLCAMMN